MNVELGIDIDAATPQEAAQLFINTVLARSCELYVYVDGVSVQIIPTAKGYEVAK